VAWTQAIFSKRNADPQQKRRSLQVAYFFDQQNESFATARRIRFALVWIRV
jgi:hypothetical protein